MATNYTPNLHLPQWVASDKPNFLAEINGAWAAIDAGYGQNKTDAATAITAANGAVTDAENAVSKVNAIAAQMVTLQQTVAQLEADFVNKAYIVTDDLTATGVGEFIVNSITAYHNGYMGKITMSIKIPVGTLTPNNGYIDVATLSGMPYVYRSFSCQSRISLQKLETVHFNSNTESWLASSISMANDTVKIISPLPIVVTAATNLTIDFDFMISTNGGNARSFEIPENCAILNA